MTRLPWLSLLGNAALAATIITIDQVTKWYVLLKCHERILVMPGVACQVVINHGISWSLFSSQSPVWFFLVSLMVASITAGVAWMGFCRWKAGLSIVAETCIVAGSCSNLLDRVMHRGVIDFISLFWRTWYFAVFNLADVFIVGGVLLFLIRSYLEQRRSHRTS